MERGLTSVGYRIIDGHSAVDKELAQAPMAMERGCVQGILTQRRECGAIRQQVLHCTHVAVVSAGSEQLAMIRSSGRLSQVLEQQIGMAVIDLSQKSSCRHRVHVLTVEPLNNAAQWRAAPSATNENWHASARPLKQPGYASSCGFSSKAVGSGFSRFRK
jgi:hypothetical protein